MVVPVYRRNDYIAALEDASVNGNIKPIAKFLAGLLSGRSRKLELTTHRGLETLHKTNTPAYTQAPLDRNNLVKRRKRKRR